MPPRRCAALSRPARRNASTASTRRWSSFEAGSDSLPKMLETCFSTAPDVTTSSRDRRVRATLGHEAEDLALARREAAQAELARVVGARAHELRDDLAIQRRAAGGDALDRLDERPHLADALLEQVADAAGSRREQLLRVDRLDVLRQDQHPEAGMLRARLDRRPHAVVGEGRRQPDVDDRDVGLVARRRSAAAPARPRPARRRRSRARAAAPRCPRAAARCPRRSRPAWQLRPDRRRPAGRRVDAQRAVDRLDAVAQPREPAALGFGAAGAQVRDLDDEALRVAHTTTRAGAPPACLATFVSASATTKYAAVSTTGGGRRSSGTSTVDRHRRAHAQRLDRGAQPAVGQHRRRDAAGEVAQLADRGAGLLAGAAHERGDLGAVGELVSARPTRMSARRGAPARRRAGRARCAAAPRPGHPAPRGASRQLVDALGELALERAGFRRSRYTTSAWIDSGMLKPERRPERPRERAATPKAPRRR